MACEARGNAQSVSSGYTLKALALAILLWRRTGVVSWPLPSWARDSQRPAAMSLALLRGSAPTRTLGRSRVRQEPTDPRIRMASAINEGGVVEKARAAPGGRSSDKESRYLLDLVLVAASSKLVQPGERKSGAAFMAEPLFHFRGHDSKRASAARIAPRARHGCLAPAGEAVRSEPPGRRRAEGESCRGSRVAQAVGAKSAAFLIFGPYGG